MQQLHSTTAEQNEQTALVGYAPPAEIVSPPEQTTKASKAEQEQSATVEKLLAALERDTQKRQKFQTVISKACVVLILLSLPVWVAARWNKYELNLASCFSWICLASAVGRIAGWLFLDKQTAAQLTKLEDVRCVGALTDIWRIQENVNYSKKMRVNARKTLTNLLPRLKASDAGLLKETQRAALRSILANNGYIGFGVYQDAAFILAILKAFEQIGDWKSLPLVQEMAKSSKNAEIRAAARECLPYLEALAEKQKPGENLLRASSMSEAASATGDTLLRPADAATETRPETLLRPAE